MSHLGTYDSPENTAREKGAYQAGPCSIEQNDAGTPGDDWHKSGTGCSGDVPDGANENPGALAGATGAGTSENAASFKTDYYRNRADAATALCHAIADCHPDDASAIMAAALESFAAGSPQPPAPWVPLIQEARDWCFFANIFEIKAYALACFEAMPAATRARFLSYAGRVAA